MKLLAVVLSSFPSITLGQTPRIGHLGKCAGEQQEMKPCKRPDCEVENCLDCVWEEWNEWSPCGCDGLQDRHRLVATNNNGCGKPCTGTRVDTKECESDCKLVTQDCILSEWQGWSDCDKTCDGGEKTERREVLQEQKNGGKVCEGPLAKITACNVQSCLRPVDCAMGEWQEWSACSRSCGGGQSERRRTLAVKAMDGGKTCSGTTNQLISCNDHSCSDDIDCRWGEWTEWGACSETCGGGDQSRSRLIEVAPRNRGALCEPLDMAETQGCNSERCGSPVDCELSSWTEWHACSCSCNGIRARGRTITKYPVDGGTQCEGALKEIQACNVTVCDEHAGPKVDCELGHWEEWGECSASCGIGCHTRTRVLKTNPLNGGIPCLGSLEQVRGCEIQCDEHGHPIKELEEGEETLAPVKLTDCDPNDCVWSIWDEWSACTASCGGGQRSRNRQITQQASAHGKPCESQASMEVGICNPEGCFCQDCVWQAWSEWSACTCTGLVQRHRSYETHFNSCGAPCNGPKVETKSCDPNCKNSPNNCVLDDWVQWSTCTCTCGGGTRARIRRVIQPSDAGGIPCSGDLAQIEGCGQEICNPPIDCALSEWDDWTVCSQTCGGGERFRDRQVTTAARFGGQPCDDYIHEVEGCGSVECGGVVDCVWGQWSDFSACSMSCGGGYKTRDRAIAASPRNGGKLCSAMPKSESVACNTLPCNTQCQNAEWEEWSEYSLCSASCGKGYSSRNRCLSHGGNFCGDMIAGPMQEYKTCNLQACEDEHVDCAFSNWGNWGDCSCVCNGVRTRSRTVTTYNNGDGKGCDGPLKIAEPCNVKSCSDWQVLDCKLSDWSHWAECSAECNGGIKSRQRSIIQGPKNGGKHCPRYLQEVVPCNCEKCSTQFDCEWDEWKEWGACSAECNSGHHSRYRHIRKMAKNGGAPCESGASVEVEPCNTQECGKVEFCGWGQWEEWGECSATCGSGEMSRARNLRISETEFDETLNVGVLNDMHSSLLQMGGQFRTEHLFIVYVFGVLSTAMLVATGYFVVRRTQARFASSNIRAPEDETNLLQRELLQSDVEAEMTNLQ